MTTHSVSFDRAASFYDQTRHLSEPMATRGLPIILEQAGPQARILEVGVGTGRISAPLIERGADVIGCDLSIEMMSKLRAKVPAIRLAQANAARLPFASHLFDALLTFHVMHLVGPWRAALREYRRVLRPGGAYITSWHWRDETSASRQMRHYWRSRVEAHGADWRRPGVQNREELLEELRALGAVLSEVEIEHGRSAATLREEIEQLNSRQYSESWGIPEDVLATSIAEASDWAQHEYGDLDQSFSEEHRLILDIARFS